MKKRHNPGLLVMAAAEQSEHSQGNQQVRVE